VTSSASYLLCTEFVSGPSWELIARLDDEAIRRAGDVQVLDHRYANRAQLIHDDRVHFSQPADSPALSLAERP
jgi:hypothetical protein